MRTFKKALCVCLAALFAVPLIGCNGGGMREYYARQSLDKMFDKFEGDLERGTEKRKIRLRVLENDTAKKTGYLQVLLDGFNEKYKDYNIVAVDANQDQYSDLAMDGPYGHGPDVLYQANDVLMKYCDGKHIMPLPVEKLDAYDELLDLAKSCYTYNYMGVDYFMGVGLNIQAPMMYYRKDLIPEDWETTWDDDKNGVPDMIEDLRAMYRFNIYRKSLGGDANGFMMSLDDPYFSSGFLFSYGAYIFGENDTDTTDIGFSKNSAEKGGAVMLSLASVMNEGCIDNSITVARESEFGKGNYFAIFTTQDMYSTMVDELTNNYTKAPYNLKKSEAKKRAIENIGTAPMPDLPASGMLDETEGDTVKSVVMGGINGYAISSYTKYPKASLAFLNYATSAEMVSLRNEYLGISPARADCVDSCKMLASVAKDVSNLVKDNRVKLMPSVRGFDQVWTPLGTAFTDFATDPYRKDDKKYYSDGKIDLAAIKSTLENVDIRIYDAIYTLS